MHSSFLSFNATCFFALFAMADMIPLAQPSLITNVYLYHSKHHVTFSHFAVFESYNLYLIVNKYLKLEYI